MQSHLTIVGCDQGFIKRKQDGLSLESSSYLNMTLRYLGPLDRGTLGHLWWWMDTLQLQLQAPGPGLLEI